MKHKIIIYCLIILVLTSVSYASGSIIFDSYTQTVELKEKNSFHQIDIMVNILQESQELNLTLPPRAENLEVFIDEQEKSCTLEERKGFSVLHCPFPEGITGKHVILLAYETTYPIFEIQNQILYKSEYLPTGPTFKFNYILKLPVGFIIPEEKDISFFVNPQPKSIYSDGRRVILLWERKEIDSAFELSVLMEPAGKHIHPIYWVIGLIFLALLVGVGIMLSLKKVKKNEIAYPALIEHEKAIVDILKKAKGHVLWQKQIQLRSGLSKVKVSRILRSLEERGVIKKEPWGNTNKVHLIAEETPKEEKIEEINKEKENN